MVHLQNSSCAIIHPTLAAADHTYTHIAYSQTQVRKWAVHILIAHRAKNRTNIHADNLPRAPGSSSAILDTDLGTRCAQVPRPAVAERKPRDSPQLLFLRHQARPNVFARLTPLAQGSGHASIPQLPRTPTDCKIGRVPPVRMAHTDSSRSAGFAQATGRPS